MSSTVTASSPVVSAGGGDSGGSPRIGAAHRTLSPKHGYRKPEEAAALSGDEDDLASTLHQLRRIGSTLVKNVRDVELDDGSHSSRALTPLRRRSECSLFSVVDVSPDATTRWRKIVAGGESGGDRSSGRHRLSPSSGRADRTRLQLVKLKERDVEDGRRNGDDLASTRSARGKRSASVVSSFGAPVSSPRTLLTLRDTTFNTSGNESRDRSRRNSRAPRSTLTASFRLGGVEDVERSVMASEGRSGGDDAQSSRRASAAHGGSVSSYREYTERQLQQQPALRRLRNVQSKVHMAESILYHALSDAGDKPPRTAEERRAEAVELEKAKLILFVGRKYNVEERITSLLSIVEAQQRTERHAGQRPVSSAERARQLQPHQVAETLKELDALVLDDLARTSRKDGRETTSHAAPSTTPAKQSSGEAAGGLAQAPAAQSISSTVVSAGGPQALSDNFNPARLRRILDRFSAELAEVQRHVQPGAEATVVKMRQDLRQDSYSNFKDMCWLIESLDSIFLSDDPAGEGAQLAEANAPTVGLSPRASGALVPPPSTRRQPNATEAQRSDGQRRSFFITGTDGIVDGSELTSFSHPSQALTHPSSMDPSLVPFSLYSSQLDTATGGTAQRRSTAAQRRETHLNHLHLLGFMADAVPDTEIDAIDAQQAIFGGRPISAPPTASSPSTARATRQGGAAGATTAASTGGDRHQSPQGRTHTPDEEGPHTDEASNSGTGDTTHTDTHSASSPLSDSRSAGSRTTLEGAASTHNVRGRPSGAGPEGLQLGGRGNGGLGGAATAAQSLALAHLRHDLLDDLKKLYKIYNYDGLVVQRREEAIDANAKSQEDYIAEMEAKLQQQVEKRQQARAAEVAAGRADEYGLNSLGGARPPAMRSRPGTTQSAAGRRTPQQPQTPHIDDGAREVSATEKYEVLPPVDVLVLGTGDDEDGGDSHAMDSPRGGATAADGAADAIGHDGAARGTDTNGQATLLAEGRCVVFEERLPCGVCFTLLGEYAAGTAPAPGTSKTPARFAKYLLQAQNDSTSTFDAAVTVLANKLKTVQVEAPWPGVRKAGLAYCVRVPPACVRRVVTLVPDAKAVASARKKSAKSKRKSSSHKPAEVAVAPPPSSAFVFDVAPARLDGEGELEEEGPDAAYNPLVSMANGQRASHSGLHDDVDELDDVNSQALSPHSTPDKKNAKPATKAAEARPAPVPTATKGANKNDDQHATKPKGKPAATPPVPSRPTHTLPVAPAEVAPATEVESPLQQFVFPVEGPTVEHWGEAHPDTTVEAIENNCVVVSVLQAEALADAPRPPSVAPQTEGLPLTTDGATTSTEEPPMAHSPVKSNTQKATKPVDTQTEAVLTVLDVFELPSEAVDSTDEEHHGRHTPPIGADQLTQPPSMTSPRGAAAPQTGLTPEAIAEAVIAQLTEEARLEFQPLHPETPVAGGTSTRDSLPGQAQAEAAQPPPSSSSRRVSQSASSPLQHSTSSGLLAKNVAEKLVSALSHSSLTARNSLGSSSVPALTGGWLPSPTIVLSSASSRPLALVEDVRPYGTLGGVKLDYDVAEADEARRRQPRPSGSAPAGLPHIRPTSSSGLAHRSPSPPALTPSSRPPSGSAQAATALAGFLPRTSHNSLYGSEIIVGGQRPSSAAKPPIALPPVTDSANTGREDLASAHAHPLAELPTPLPTVPTKKTASAMPETKSQKTPARVPPPLPPSRFQLAPDPANGVGEEDQDDAALKNLLRGPVAPPPIVVTHSADTGAVNVFLPPDAERMGLYDAMMREGERTRKPKTKAGKKDASKDQKTAKVDKNKGDSTTTGDDMRRTARPDSSDDTSREDTSDNDEPAFVSNVKHFLHHVAQSTKASGESGGGGGGTRFASSVPVTSAVAGSVTAAVAAPVFSELQFLEEQARELYRQDPLRYDTVMDDLIRQAKHQMDEVAAEESAARTQAAAASATRHRLPPRFSSTSTSDRESGTGVRHSLAMSSITFNLEQGGQLSAHEGRGGHSTRPTLPGYPSRPLMRGSVNAPSHSSRRGSSLRHAQQSRHGSGASTAVLQPIAKDELNGEARKGGLANVEAGKDEVQSILYEQMKAKLMLRAIIAQMQRLWARKEAEKDMQAKEAMRRAFERAADISWQFEKRRVVNLHKLIHLLDRRVGRVHGWIPMYNDLNVLTDARGFAEPTTDVTSYTMRRAQTYAATTVVGGSRFARSAAVLCAPQQQMRQAMCLAKRRRLLPVRLLRQQVGEEWNHHLLFGYKKHAMHTQDERRVHHQRGRGEPWRTLHFSDMESTGERLRYRRRLQGAAPFQSASKMYSPRQKRDQDLPFTK